jgi:hypothetical protein
MKTPPQIDVMVSRMESLLAKLPPKSGSNAYLRWIISDLQSVKSGKRPEIREAGDWLYDRETGLNRLLTFHEKYLELVEYLQSNEITITFDEYGVTNDRIRFVMLQLHINDSLFDSVGMKMYNDRILETVSPGEFRVMPYMKWEAQITRWCVCNDCKRVTYGIPCDFCGCKSISPIVRGVA